MNHRSSLSSTALAALLLLAPEAEARFGKRSSSSSAGRKPGRSGASTHAASPVRSSAPRASRPPAVSVRSRGSRYAVAPATAGVSAASEDDRDAPRKHFVFGLDVQALGRGGGTSLHLGIESGRLGVMLRAGGLSLPTDDGRGLDSLGLLSAHVSYAVLAGERGRLRLEGGVSAIRAPDATFVGPSVGSSAEYFLFDALAVEGRVHVTPVPHRQLDAAGGLVWYFFEDLFALRGGMRMLVLDDAGLVDGVIHRELLTGPYLAAGLAL